MIKTADEKAKEVCRTLNLPEMGPAFFAIRKAIKEQDRDTRHACAEAVVTISAEVANTNTYRGRVNQTALFACDQLGRAAGACMNVQAT